ncbi:MAG: Glu/Leu/Phe/Val dehydrogenase dimerization domain-containing protein [Chlamydiales bacterium]|nr:Glu/Leu/Phe/Val dehydrogenase dimerization domain-containing protein [Chlamydiales bacterium]
MVLELNEIPLADFEKVIEVINRPAGLHAFIALHNTSMGPTLGGTRIYPYANRNDALTDVLRLSEGMTYKSALAGTGFGGGKSVIIANPSKDKNADLLMAFGEAVHALGGQYICAEDVGSTKEDMLEIRKKTPYVVGLPLSTSSGDPSPFTAWGVFIGIQATAKKLWGSINLQGRTIVIQGLGSVGAKVADLLFWQGANLILSDIDLVKAEALGRLYNAEVVSPDAITQVKCDIFCPCALGGILNAKSIPLLQCEAIAGAANNQLLTHEDGVLLHQRGILYAPDFIINSGGLINVSCELERLYNPRKSLQSTNAIYDTLLSIYNTSEKENLSTNETAIELAKYKIQHGIGRRTEAPCFKAY